MDDNTARVLAILIAGLIGTALTFARRYNNPQDPIAGRGTSGWTIVIILLLILAL